MGANTIEATPRTPTALRTAPPRYLRLTLWAVFAIMLAAGSVGVAERLVNGHLSAGYGSYVPWGLWVAIYFQGVAISAGVMAVSSLGFLLRVRGLDTRRSIRSGVVLTVAAMAPALLAIGLDLGRFERAWRIAIDPSFTSAMAFNFWTYVAFLTVCAVVWFLSFRPDRGWLRPFLALAFVLAAMAASQSGVFLGVVRAEPHWNTALLPVLMFTSAMVAGAATLLLVRTIIALVDPPVDLPEHENERSAAGLLRIVVLVGVAVYFFLEFAELTIDLWNPGPGSPELDLVLTGPYWWVFWLVHVGGGVAAVALLMTRRPGAWAAAGGLVVLSFLGARLNVLVPAQAVEQLEGLQAAFWHPRLDHVYQATVMEYLVALFLVAMGMAILYIGSRITTAALPYLSGKEQADDGL